MTTAAGGKRPLRRVGQFLAWMSHFEVATLVAMVPAIVIGAAVSNDSVWSWLSVGVLVFVLAATVGNVFHDMTWPCDFCYERFPLDAPGVAEKRRKELLRAHSRRLAINFGLVALGVGIAGPIVLKLLGVPGLLSAVCTTAPVYGWWAYMAFVRRTHRKFQPWCPICRGRDEGDDPIIIPVPTPPSAKIDA